MGNKAALKGTLEFIELADLFQLLGGNNATGRLQITSQYAPSPGVIYFQNGDPISAKVGSEGGVKGIYSLFGWKDGRFEFYDEAVKAGRTIKNTRMQIVLDALKMMDDGEIEILGPPSLDAAAAAAGGKAGKKEALPAIKGPMVDYVLVISEDSFQDGRQIVKEGGYGRWIWVVLEGVVNITRETEKGVLTLARLGEGSFIGAFGSLVHDKSPRSATATASGHVTLGVLDADRLTNEFSALSEDFKNLLLSLDGRLRKINDAAVAFYLGKASGEAPPKDGKVVMKQGASTEESFVISGGTAHVLVQTEKGGIPLFTLEAKDVFGFIPFMDIGHEPKFASVVGSPDLELKETDRERLQREYDGLSGALRNFIYSVGTCISMTTSLACHLKDKT